ncbi:MAG: DUF1592 domain-containing protein [Rubripirellula sp.]|nr:DUF1592 domain-containing protein [Rubripirellula sp.]
MAMKQTPHLLPIGLLLFQVVFCQATVSSAAPPQAVVPQQHRAVLQEHCFDCHDSQSKEGGVDLQSLSLKIDTVETAERWQKVLAVLNSGEMPPEDEPQITPKQKTLFLDDLSAQIVVARDVLTDSAGVITMRRLNRREYENTVFDLVGVRVDAKDLPSDANSQGFDTAGGSLFFSSDQFEQYLTLANQALEAAFVVGKKPKQRTVRRESESLINPRFMRLRTKLKKDFDRAGQWRATNGQQSPAEFGFIDEGDVQFHERLHRQQYASYVRYLEKPESKTGVLLNKMFNGAIVDTITIPNNWPDGEYILRARVAGLEGSQPKQRFLEYGIAGDGARSGELKVIGCNQVTGTISDPQILEIPLTVKEERGFGLRQRQPNSRAATRTAFLQAQVKTGVGPPAALWIDWIEVTGPVLEVWPPPSTSKIFFKGMWWHQPDEDTYAREIIQRFAERAFRIKPPSQSFVDKLFKLYAESRRDGEKFPTAIRQPLAVIMASPGFLYQIEPASMLLTEGIDEQNQQTLELDALQPKELQSKSTQTQPKQSTGQLVKQSSERLAEQSRELNDLELAVRLAYFLWSSPPDQTLYAAAKRGDLKRPSLLSQQVNRMLDDPRADELIARFAHQWLAMERLDFFQFDAKQYPEFDESVKQAARQEVYATIRSMLNENRPLGDLLNPNYVVINDLMADYYGIEGVQGGEFRKVAIPEGSPRGGLLAMAAILAMGSDGTRSSPVERGAWVMRKILDNPPPPAPANVPQLSRLIGKLLSPREIQQAHMEEPQCAQCHRKIDPIGFGMQNFDAAGKWREKVMLQQTAGKRVIKKKLVRIDPQGQLPDGSPFENFVQLREQIALKDNQFARGFTEALIEYALGRPYGFSDEGLRERMISRAGKQDGSIRDYIMALVQSKKFRTKK